MNTVLSQDGVVIIPEELREQLQLIPGDEFEIKIEDDHTFSMRRISRKEGAMENAMAGSISA